MVYTKFSSSSKKVSRLGFGAMGFGGAFGTINEKEAIHSVINSLEKGVNFIDTARHYGDSELIVGKALKEWKGEQPFIATKIQSYGNDNTRWGLPPDVNTCFPKGCIKKDTELSLKTLGIDKIDLMQLHLYWPNWGTEGYWLEDLLKLKEEGKIELIGISNPDHRCDTAIPLVMSGAIDSVQTIINIFDPLALDCLVPICKEKNVSVIARCVMDEGGLTGFLKEDMKFEETDFRKSFFDRVPRKMYIEKVDALRKYIPEHASSLASLALKFVLKDAGVTVAITSMHIEEFANMNIEALNEAPLSDELFYKLRTKHRWIRNFFDSKFWMNIDGLK